MNTLISESADPKKFYWMRYVAERATSVTIKGEQVKIVKGDLFGVRELNGKDEDELMLLDNSVFRLPIAKSETLMNRAKEYKGAIKSTQPAPAKKPVLVPKPSGNAPKAISEKSPNEAKFANLVHQYGGYTLSTFKQVIRVLKDDPIRISFKQWMLNRIDRKAPAYNAIQAIIIGTKKATEPKILLQKKAKPTVTKLTQHKGVGGPFKVKLSQTELPNEEDFTDHDLPHEFRQFARVESSDPRWMLSLVSESTPLDDVMPGTFEDFNKMVRATLAPHVAQLEKNMEAAIEIVAKKIKAWALIHLTQARHLGKRTELFEKMMNNPVITAKQIVLAMLNVKSGVAPKSAHSPAMIVDQDEEAAKIDDVLQGIQI